MSLNSFLIFSVDHQFYALPITAIRQVIRSVQLTNVHEAPDLLHGLINMKGKIIPVINIRKQFKIPEKTILLSDRIIIAQYPPHNVAFVVDAVEGIVELSKAEITPSTDIFPQMEDYIIGTAKFKDDTVLIYDIGSLFSQKEIERITEKVYSIKETA